MKTIFEQIWNELETESSSIYDKGILKRLVGTGKTCPMFLGIQKPSKLRVFILQIPKDFAPMPDTIPESKGFNFSVQITGEETLQDYVSIILVSSESAYNDIFLSISEDLYSTLSDLDNKKEITVSFLNRVLLWQNFFEKQNADGLSESSQKGLYGELLFLDRYLLIQKYPYERILRFWTGPKARQHDFQFGALSVEVKTTSSKQHQKLHISSEQQLDDSLVEELYLFYLSVSLIENSDDTLPFLVESIRTKLKENIKALTLFNICLIDHGYLDVHKSKYENTGYSLREYKFFLIHDEFPRIKEKEIRKGVGDVEYTVSVDECLSYVIEEVDFINSLEKSVL